MSFIKSLFRINPPSSDMIEILGKEDFKNAIAKKDALLIDVRTAREYNTGHIANAKNIDFFQMNNFKKAFEKIDKKKPIYLYCRSGNRSQKAAARLTGMGFEKIIDLKGGYMNWS